MLLWRLITSPSLQAFADFLKPSKQLQQSQHFGNIATILTIKRLVTGAESTSHNGGFAGMRDAQEPLQLSSAPSQVCLPHVGSPCSLMFPMKIEVCSCWGEASCWHREGWQRRQGQTSYWVKNAAVCQFRAVWQKVSLPLHFPDCIQLFAIPSCLFSNLVANDSSALVCSSFPPKPPALPACSLPHQPTGANLLPGLVPLAQPSQVISPSPSWRKVSESPFICISVFGL